MEIHGTDMTEITHRVLQDAISLTKKKKIKIVDAVVGKIAQNLMENGAKFDLDGKVILWPGGWKTFIATEINQFTGATAKKGRPKKQKKTDFSEKLVTDWSKQPQNNDTKSKCNSDQHIYFIANLKLHP